MENMEETKMRIDKQLFQLLDKKTQYKWKKFSKYYFNDSKPFINKISRDNESSGEFPIHIYKTIKKIDKTKYGSAICVLRGALPYAIMFEVLGWKINYVICGRRNEKHVDEMSSLRFNKSIDKKIGKIKGKKVLIIENNSVKGITPVRVATELIKSFKIKKPDLFLDYFVPKNDYLKKGGVKFFKDDQKKVNSFEKIYVATKVNKQRKFSPNLQISTKEKSELKNELLEKLK